MGDHKTEFGLGRKNQWASLLKWGIVGLCIGSAGLGGQNAGAITPQHFMTAGQRVLGSDLVEAADSSATAGPAFIVELGERWLFGIEGLRTDGFRIGWHRDRMRFFMSGSNVVSPVGSEKTGDLGGYFRAPAKVWAGWRLSGSLIEVPPYSRTGLISLSGAVVSRLNSGLAVGFEAGDVRLSGEPFPGADISVWTCIRPLPSASLILTVSLSRWGGMELGFAGSFRLARSCSLSAGYDDVSKQIKTALNLSSGAIGCGLGAMFHPLLGMSKEINLRWQR